MASKNKEQPPPGRCDHPPKKPTNFAAIFIDIGGSFDTVTLVIQFSLRQLFVCALSQAAQERPWFGAPYFARSLSQGSVAPEQLTSDRIRNSPACILESGHLLWACFSRCSPARK